MGSAIHPFSTGDTAVWQQNGLQPNGKLSLTSGGKVVASVKLDGFYVPSTVQSMFTVQSDNNGGTLIKVQNPPPPSGITRPDPNDPQNKVIGSLTLTSDQTLTINNQGISNLIVVPSGRYERNNQQERHVQYHDAQ